MLAKAIRHLGMMRTGLTYEFGIMEYFLNKEVKRQEDTFSSEMQHLAAKEVYTRNDYKLRIQSTIQKHQSNFRSHFGQAKKQIAQQKDIKKVLNCLFEEELNGTEPLSKDQITEISQITNLRRDFVQKVESFYANNKIIHEYIHLLIKRKSPLPTNQEQLEKDLTAHQEYKRKNLKQPLNKKQKIADRHRHHEKISRKHKIRWAKFHKF